MGKDWLYWVGGGRSSGRRRRISGEMKEAATTTSAGCMCAVFQLFNLHHHFQFPSIQHNPTSEDINPFLQEEATPISRGVEAPRNSLELEEPAAMKAASPSIKEEENLNFTVGIQIKTSHAKTSSSPRVSTTTSKSRMDEISSECSISSNSPGTKTPNLVARLMGLDLLPECTSPSISSSSSSPKPKLKSHHQRRDTTILQSRLSGSFFQDDISVGARSLPETPRISSARRSDVDYHRLSLQINKENSNKEEFAVVGRRGRRLVQEYENTISPGNYARQIVKQVKESVSRRVVGRDITNTDRNRLSDHHTPRRDENLVLLKPTKKTRKNSYGEMGSEEKHSVTRIRLSDNGKNRSTRVSISYQQRNRSDEVVVPWQEQHKDSKNDVASSSSSTRLKKLFPPQACDHVVRNKKEETFVRPTASNKLSLPAYKKCKKSTPLSSDVFNMSSGPTLLQVKKSPSPPTKLPQKQSQVSDALTSKRSIQLSRNPRHSYNHLRRDNIITAPHPAVPDITNCCATALHGGASPEYRSYIQTILHRADVTNKTNLPTSWHIDPSIFHHLEPFTTAASSAGSAGRNTTLSHRSNSKLIFQLVDELLGEMLRPHFNLKPLISPCSDGDGSSWPLVDHMCKKIESFPAANCLVLEDIDSLIEKYLRKCGLNGFCEEDGISIVSEVEGEIVEWLVRETVAVMGGCAAEEQDRG